MAELKATRGPYKVDIRVGCLAVYPANEHHNCLAGIDKTAVHYAHGEQAKGEDGMIHWNISEEKVANAHLLAASWEMYHVLDYALAALKHYFHAHDSGVDGICLQIEAVMAEARGEAT